MNMARKQSRRVSSATMRAFAPGKSLGELYEEGKRLRDKCPRQSSRGVATTGEPPGSGVAARAIEQRAHPPRIPVRYGRTTQTPSTFYRGAALNMAADLAATPIDRAEGAGLWGLSSAEFRGFRDTGKARDLRHQRSR